MTGADKHDDLVELWIYLIEREEHAGAALGQLGDKARHARMPAGLLAHGVLPRCAYGSGGDAGEVRALRYIDNMRSFVASRLIEHLEHPGHCERAHGDPSVCLGLLGRVREKRCLARTARAGEKREEIRVAPGGLECARDVVRLIATAGQAVGKLAEARDERVLSAVTLIHGFPLSMSSHSISFNLIERF